MPTLRTRARKPAALLLLVVPLLLALQVAVPSVAEARCAAVNTPRTSELVISGLVVVRETPDSGTCNGNNTYQASFRAMNSNWKAWVAIQNNGSWRYFEGHPRGNTQWKAYALADNNSRTYMALCASDASRTYCGWGSEYITIYSPDPRDFAPSGPWMYGLNTGF